MEKQPTIAFYKRSKSPWTDVELYAINVYMGYLKPDTYTAEKDYGNVNPAYKWCYNMSREVNNLDTWSVQEPETENYKHYFTHMAYEDIFNPPKQLQTYNMKDFQ